MYRRKFLRTIHSQNQCHSDVNLELINVFKTKSQINQMEDSISFHEGRITGRVFRTKKMECSFFLFCGFFLMIPSLVFCWCYYKKLDVANFDAYDILDDSLAANKLNPIGLEAYSQNDLVFKINGYVDCHPENATTRIKRGHYFTNLYDRVFMIKTYKHEHFWQYQKCSPELKEEELAIVANRMQANRQMIEESKRTFFVDLNYTVFDPQTNQLTTQYLSGLHIIYYVYNSSTNGNIYGFSDDVRASYSSTPKTHIDLEIHFANEYLTYDFPTFSFSMIMAVSFPLFLLGIVFIIFFLWHCWSYKYILIKRAINESGLDFER